VFYWSLPGQSDLPTNPDYCGTVRTGAKCPECNTRVIITNNCDKPECPVCHSKYAQSHGSDVSDFLDGSNRAYYNAGVKLGYLKHYTISPPQDWAIEQAKTYKGFKKVRDKAKKHLQALGLVGGSIVFHYYRLLPQISDLIKKQGYGTGKVSKGSLWQGALDDCLGLGSVYSYVYPSPHFHVIAVGRNSDTNVYYAKTGWLLKLINSINERSLSRRYRHLKNVATYQLNHASRLVQNGKYKTHAVSYFGCFSSHYVGVEQEFLQQEAYPCPVCDKDYLHRCAMSTDPDYIDTENGILWHIDCGIYFMTVKYRIYALKPVYNPYLAHKGKYWLKGG
jgi:hypothetical protein